MKTLLLTPLFLLLTTCSSPTEPPGPPTIEGEVTAIDQSDGLFEVLVEENPQVDDPLASEGAKIRFQLNRETVIIAADGSGADPGKITVGSQVRAWAEGPLEDSYPQFGSAALLRIISGGR